MPDDEVTQETALEPANEAAAGAAVEVQEQEAQPQPEPAAEAQPEPTKPAKNPVKPFQARIDELTRNWREEQRQRQAIERELEAYRSREQQAQQTEQPTEQQPRQNADVVPANMVEELAAKRAEAIANQRQFDNDCNLTFAKGKAAHPDDFEEAVQTFGALGGLQRDVVEDVLATDTPEEVLYALGKDADEAMRILQLPRAKRIAEFTKMTMKAPAAKPATSKASPPIAPVGGKTSKDFDFADAEADDAEWFERRAKARREAGRI